MNVSGSIGVTALLALKFKLKLDNQDVRATDQEMILGLDGYVLQSE